MKCTALRSQSYKGFTIRLAAPCLLALMAITTPASAAGNQFLKIEGIDGESMSASSPILGGDRVAVTEAGFKAFFQKNSASGKEFQYYTIELVNAAAAALRTSKNGRIRVCVRDLCISGKRLE